MRYMSVYGPAGGGGFSKYFFKKKRNIFSRLLLVHTLDENLFSPVRNQKSVNVRAGRQAYVSL